MPVANDSVAGRRSTEVRRKWSERFTEHTDRRCESLRVVTTCTPAGIFVSEQGLFMRLVRSANIFAAGLDPKGAGLIVRFCNNRDGGGLYRYLDAGDEQLQGLLTAEHPTRFLRHGIGPNFEFERLECDLRHPLELTWEVCSACAIVHDPFTQWSEVCVRCDERTVERCIDNCATCHTYYASPNSEGAPPLGRRCSEDDVQRPT